MKRYQELEEWPRGKITELSIKVPEPPDLNNCVCGGVYVGGVGLCVCVGEGSVVLCVCICVMEVSRVHGFFRSVPAAFEGDLHPSSSVSFAGPSILRECLCVRQGSQSIRLLSSQGRETHNPD